MASQRRKAKNRLRRVSRNRVKARLEIERSRLRDDEIERVDRAERNRRASRGRAGLRDTQKYRETIKRMARRESG